MQRRIFLTGPAGSGKSSLIREALGDRLAGAGGFITGPVIGPGGYAEGYALRPAAAAAGVEGLPSAVFLDCGVWPPKRDNEVFRSLGVDLLREAAYYPFAVVDEIGGYELLIPQFREALCALLDSGLPVLGALKSAAEAEQWRQLFGLGPRCTAQTDALRRRIGADPDARILDLAETDADAVRAALADWTAAWA